MRALILLLAISGCSAGAEPAPSLCGWTLQGTGFTGDTWSHADTSAGCGLLPVNVSPCDMAPAQRWENDGVDVVGWQLAGAECHPTLYLK